jgi:hypothetical protein
LEQSVGHTANSEDDKEKEQEKPSGHERHNRKYLPPTRSTPLFFIAIAVD